MLFFEASAKTKLGVQDAFLELVEKILDSPSLLEERSGSTASNNVNLTQNKESGGCPCTLI